MMTIARTILILISLGCCRPFDNTINENVKSDSVERLSKPNIVLIVADDLGFNDVPWHNKDVIAPNIDNLARKGIILEQSYVQPVCSPTRSALLSGRYPFTIGRQGDVIWPLMPTGLSLKLPIIPQMLKPLGYETHAVGKWHVGFCNWRYTPTERGFDTFYGFYTGSEDYYSHIRHYYRKQAANGCSNPSTPNVDGSYTGYDFRNNRKPDYEANGTYSTYLYASHVEDILRSSQSYDPKFIYLAFQSVHSPLQVPDNYTKPYQYIKDKNRRTYLGMVTAMDEAIGRVIKALKETNRYENSVIIFTTDNGGPTLTGANNWPLRGNKTTLWEGGTRGAAFVHSPLISKPGSVSHELIHTTDWMSTILHLAGGSAPKYTDGFNQWEAINGEAKSVRKEMIYNINNNCKGFQTGIRYGKYKLLVGDPGPGDWTPPPEIEFSESKRSENPSNQVSGSDASGPFFDHWTYKHHLKYVNQQISKCSNDECISNILSTYKNAKALNMSKIAHQKIIYIIKRKRKSLKKWHRMLGVLNGKKDSRMKEKFFLSQRQVDGKCKFLGMNSSVLHLYNLKEDPNEKKNIAQKQPDMLKLLLKKLFIYCDRWVPPDEPDDDPKGNPALWGDLWSPGWC